MIHWVPSAADLARAQEAMNLCFGSSLPEIRLHAALAKGAGPTIDKLQEDLGQAVTAFTEAELTIASLRNENARLQEDAARWRALMSGERMRLQGWAGPRDGFMHFGMEFWTQHGGAHDPEWIDRTKGQNDQCREVITMYVDTIRRTESKS